MAKGRNRNKETSGKTIKCYLFYEKLMALMRDKYGSYLPREYEYLMEILGNPRELILKDKNSMVVSRSDKSFKVERAFENLIQDLSLEERKQLIPRTSVESRDMRAFAEATKTGRNEDTLWRKLTGYANLNYELTNMLAKTLSNQRCLEIMAGNGLLSYMLQESGLRVIATDIAPNKSNDYISMRDGTYCDVLGMDAVSAIRKYGQHTDCLICSWPPHQEEQVLLAFKAFMKLNPKGHMLYLGEWKGGFNATDTFFDQVEVEDALETVNAIHICHVGSKDVIRLLRIKDE